jgi:hypothetical protein
MSGEQDVQKFSLECFSVMDKILQHFAGPQYKEEVRFAKSEFFDNAGILEEGAVNFELRMNQFFDWYFFTRELRGIGHTPLESYHMVRELRLSELEIQIIEKLKQHRHSIFEFSKTKGTDVYIKDLIYNEKMTVQQSPWIYGFDSAELFEARLIPFNNTWIFTKGFCFHPSDAKKFILSEIKRHRKDPDLDPQLMMLRLIRMRYKFERYRHVKVDMIYSNENKMGM